MTILQPTASRKKLTHQEKVALDLLFERLIRPKDDGTCAFVDGFDDTVIATMQGHHRRLVANHRRDTKGRLYVRGPATPKPTPPAPVVVEPEQTPEQRAILNLHHQCEKLTLSLIHLYNRLDEPIPAEFDISGGC